MQIRNRNTVSLRYLILFGALFTTPAILSCAQTITPAEREPNEKDKKDKKEEVILLKAFEVTAEENVGYFKKNTMAGTRSSERISNIPQSIQIVTSQMIEDIPMDNTVEILQYGVSGVNKRTNILGDMFLRGFCVRTFLKDNIFDKQRMIEGGETAPGYMLITAGPSSLAWITVSKKVGLAAIA